MLEYISQRNGTKAFIALKPAIYKNIFDNFERDGTEVYAVLVPDADKTTADGPSTDDDDVSSTASAAIPIIAHDTVGWKALESSIGALTGMIRGCGPAFVTEGHLDDDIRRNILPRASDHINRFVREAAYFLLNAVVEVCSVEYLLESGFDADAATLAAKGLHDNWSQVRFAASVATRALMTKSDGTGPCYAMAHRPSCVPTSLPHLPTQVHASLPMVTQAHHLLKPIAYPSPSLTQAHHFSMLVCR